MGLFGGSSNEESDGIPMGIYTGVQTGNRGVATDSALDARAQIILDQICAPGIAATSFAINDVGVASSIAIGTGANAFIQNPGDGVNAYRFVNNSSIVKLQYKATAGSSWTDYNGSAQAEVTVPGVGTFNKAVTGTYNEATGKITLECKLISGTDSTSVVIVYTRT